MDKRIDKILPYAFEAVKTTKGFLKFDKQQVAYIPKQYNGYISSFGAAIIQSGLLAAITFNSQLINNENGEKTKQKSEVDKKPLMDAIYFVVKKIRSIKNNQSDCDTLLEFAKIDKDKRLLKKHILEAATSIKLVIRTYKLKKDD